DVDQERLGGVVLGDFIEPVKDVLVLDDDADHVEPRDMIAAAQRIEVPEGPLRQNDGHRDEDDDGGGAPERQPPLQSPPVQNRIYIERHRNAPTSRCRKACYGLAAHSLSLSSSDCASV